MSGLGNQKSYFGLYLKYVMFLFLFQLTNKISPFFAKDTVDDDVDSDIQIEYTAKELGKTELMEYTEKYGIRQNRTNGIY